MVTKTTEDFVWGALLGGLVGAATALLFTPTSGSKFRDQVRNGFHFLNGKKSSHSRSRARAVVRAGAARALSRQVRQKAKSVRRKVKRALSQAQHHSA